MLELLTVKDLSLYIELKKYRKLTEKELQRGKSLKIYGTNEDMPWSTVYNRLASGQPIDEVAKQYGHGRKLALWAQQDNVTLDQQSKDIIERETKVRQEVQQIANDDPEKAITILQRVNEVSPDFQRNVAVFADKLVTKAIDKLNDKYLEPADMEKLANAVQKTTDTVGVTQRHSGGININNNTLNIPEGFSVIPATPPEGFDPEQIMRDGAVGAVGAQTPVMEAEVVTDE